MTLPPELLHEIELYLGKEDKICLSLANKQIGFSIALSDLKAIHPEALSIEHKNLMRRLRSWFPSSLRLCTTCFKYVRCDCETCGLDKWASLHPLFFHGCYLRIYPYYECHGCTNQRFSAGPTMCETFLAKGIDGLGQRVMERQCGRRVSNREKMLNMGFVAVVIPDGCPRR